MSEQTVAVAADHAGYELKETLKKELARLGFRALDLGTDSTLSVDYPDFADRLAGALARGDAGRGVLICGTGIGISIAANRHEHVRAALVHGPDEARLARQHNDANVLALGARFIDEASARASLEAFLGTSFEGGRHARRVAKLVRTAANSAESLSMTGALSHSSDRFFGANLAAADPAVFAAIRAETGRQQEQIELIASENIVSRAVLEAQGSVLTNKYAEGYPGKRYYGGCEHVDVAEQLAIDRACKLFGCSYANVQPHSGAQANQAVFLALLQPGDTVMGMSLAAGGHLTHGVQVNLSGKWFKAVNYGVRRQDSLIDFDELEGLAREHRPKLIIAGGSAYPREIDFARFRRIADGVGATLMVDMAHFAGLVAGGVYPSPLPHAQVVTTTTHKTLRGPRGGMILSNDLDLGKKINSAVFPGLQGGPLMHVIAAKAVAFGEALDPSFMEYARRVVDNAKVLAETLMKQGLDIVSGGTDSHLMLVDLRPKSLTGKVAEHHLEQAGITCNKNGIPFDPQKPAITSGVRLGTPAATTRGFGAAEFRRVGELIGEVLDGLAKNGEGSNGAVEARVRDEVRALCRRFPIYPDRI